MNKSTYPIKSENCRTTTLKNWIKTLVFGIILFANAGNYCSAQYSETFPIPEKGILLGPCPGGTSASCALTDFNGVNWDINGNFVGFDATFGSEDYLKTIAGVLEFGGDIDEELCWESPVLDISAVVGAVSASVAIVWTGHDAADYVDVEYQLDGGSWLQVPNMFGGGIHTIDFPTSGNIGSATINTGNIAGTTTLSVRVCVDTNTSAEKTTIDNVSVPEVGVVLMGSTTFTALADLCIDAGVQTGLGGGMPIGGVYSGPGVTDNGNGMTYSFNPAAAGAGTHTLTYTESGSPATDDVVVFGLPAVTFTALADLCIDAGVQTGLGSGSPT